MASRGRRRRRHQWLRVEGVAGRTNGFALKASAAASVASRGRRQRQHSRLRADDGGYQHCFLFQFSRICAGVNLKAFRRIATLFM
jgi:hypothetical protein